MITQMVNTRGRAVANQFVISAGDSLTFQSYNTLICKIQGEKLYLNNEWWDYSNTTRKYFKMFVENNDFEYNNKADFVRMIECNKNIIIVDGLE